MKQLERAYEDRLAHISLMENQLKEADRKQAEHHQKTIELQTRIETLQEHLQASREEVAKNEVSGLRFGFSLISFDFRERPHS